MCCVQWFSSLKAEASNWCNPFPQYWTHPSKVWLSIGSNVLGVPSPGITVNRMIPMARSSALLLDPYWTGPWKKRPEREICDKPRSRSIVRRKRIALLQRHRNGRGPRVRSCYSPVSWDKTHHDSELVFCFNRFQCLCVCVQGLNENIESK